MRNIIKACIEATGTYGLIMDTRCHLDLEKCLYVSDCARNLVSTPKLGHFGFNFKITNDIFSLYRHQHYYGYGTLMDDLYHCNHDVNFAKSLFNVEHSIESKHSAHDECSTFLWHQRLGYNLRKDY